METVRAHLLSLADPGYRDFQRKLIPTLAPERILGVRTPALRAYAKSLVKTGEAPAFLLALPHLYYDENQLHALLLNEERRDLPGLLAQVEAFLPYVDNWANCDTLSPKLFKKDPDLVRAHVERWLDSSRTYTVRFAVDVLLRFYLGEQFRPTDLERLAALPTGEYYINMAVAWYMSYALIQQWDAALPLFQTKRLDPWVHNKSLQKAVESRRLSPETKAFLKTLRR